MTVNALVTAKSFSDRVPYKNLQMLEGQGAAKQLYKWITDFLENNADMFKAKFVWARGYGAFSVSENQLDIVIKYIKNQKEHHSKMSFAREWELFQQKYLETVRKAS